MLRLSDDQQKWIEMGKIEEKQTDVAIATLNGKIYITGGSDR